MGCVFQFFCFFFFLVSSCALFFSFIFVFFLVCRVGWSFTRIIIEKMEHWGLNVEMGDDRRSTIIELVAGIRQGGN